MVRDIISRTGHAFRGALCLADAARITRQNVPSEGPGKKHPSLCIVQAILCALCLIALCPAVASADTADIATKFFEQLTKMLRTVGVFVTAIGGFQLFMSLYNDQPEQKVRAVTLIVAGIIMFGVKSIADAFGLTDLIKDIGI